MSMDGKVEERRTFLTVATVAEMWNVSDDKVRASIRKGALSAYVVDGCLRILYEDAVNYGRPLDPSIGGQPQRQTTG